MLTCWRGCRDPGRLIHADSGPVGLGRARDAAFPAGLQATLLSGHRFLTWGKKPELYHQEQKGNCKAMRPILVKSNRNAS